MESKERVDLVVVPIHSTVTTHEHSPIGGPEGGVIYWRVMSGGTIFTSELRPWGHNSRGDIIHSYTRTGIFRGGAIFPEKGSVGVYIEERYRSFICGRTTKNGLPGPKLLRP